MPYSIEEHQQMWMSEQTATPGGTRKPRKRLNERLGHNRAAIVGWMMANPKVTVSEITHALHVSRTAVDKNIQLLKSRGIVTRKAPARGGRWEVQK